MSFDLFVMESQILAQLAVIASPIPIVGIFDRVDLTDESAYPAGVQVFFLRLTPEDQVARSALHGAHWSFDLYVDTGRITPAQKTAAAALYSAALDALIGWEFFPGRKVHTSVGSDSAVDGRIVRISFGFTLPVYWPVN